VDPERFITSEKKNVLVDYFVKWRMFDVEKFYVSFSGDERRAANRLAQTVNDGMRAEFGQAHRARRGIRRARRCHGFAAPESRRRRPPLWRAGPGCAHQAGGPAGSEVSESVYRRMDAERKRVANELRSTGGAEAEKIRADADKQREIIVAEAYRDAQRIKGEGDGKASAIYGAAYGQNPEFYAFYRSMESYRNSFRNKTDLMVAAAQFRVLPLHEVLEGRRQVIT
jgi:membrane protease subunit HflC